jgi:hypothetical protein
MRNLVGTLRIYIAGRTEEPSRGSSQQPATAPILPVLKLISRSINRTPTRSILFSPYFKTTHLDLSPAIRVHHLALKQQNKHEK